jgi:O-antigen ligase
MSRFVNSKALQTPVAPSPSALSVRPVGPPVMAGAPPLPASYRSRDAAEANSLRKLGLFLLLGYAFVRFSFLSDIAAYVINSNPYIVPALGVPALALMLITGGIPRAFRGRAAYYMAALMFWLVLVTPLSTWIGGSVQVLVQAFETEFSMLFLIAGMLITRREVDWFLSMLAVAAAFLVLSSFYYGTQNNGRFSFSFGTLQNPNDFATHLLLLIPFLLLVVLNSSSSLFRFSAGAFMLLDAYLVLKSGSRGAMLVLCAMLGFFFLKGTTVQRVGIAVSMVILSVVMFFMLPRATLQRYLMLVDSSSVAQDDAENQELEMAKGSSEAREDLLTNSLMVTAEHPLFGVGPGMFAVSEANRAKAQGQRTGWQVTHNSYTEISSEAGIPGFLLWVSTLVSTFLLLRTVYARAKADPHFTNIRNTAFCMILSVLGFSICIFFSSMSYRYYLPSLAGLTIAFAAAAQREMNNGAPVRPVVPPWAPRTTR